MKSLSFLLSLIMLFSCTSKTGTSDAQKAPPMTMEAGVSLKELWSSDTVFLTPESVLYDKGHNLVYVANVNMNPWEKDGNGFISKMDLRGKVLDLNWVSGLNGPKGMGIIGNSLFVADIDEVVEINMESGQILNRFKVDGTPTLNDITVLNNVVYISGSDSNKVFELRDGKVTTILEGDFGRPNGLYAEANRLLMLTSGSSMLKSFDYDTKVSTDLVGGFGHGDGIVPAGNGDYLASSWKGELFYVSSDWKRTPLLDTQADEINAADIDYIIDKNMLLVPTFFDNRVVAYEVVK